MAASSDKSLCKMIDRILASSIFKVNNSCNLDLKKKKSISCEKPSRNQIGLFPSASNKTFTILQLLETEYGHIQQQFPKISCHIFTIVSPKRLRVQADVCLSKSSYRLLVELMIQIPNGILAQPPVPIVKIGTDPVL